MAALRQTKHHVCGKCAPEHLRQTLSLDPGVTEEFLNVLGCLISPPEPKIFISLITNAPKGETAYYERRHWNRILYRLIQRVVPNCGISGLA
jgi:hypothetical protein